MTNEERQKKLDEQKWLESEKKGLDMTGRMDYCYSCLHQSLEASQCGVSQSCRESNYLCAKAYNSMRRKK